MFYTIPIYLSLPTMIYKKTHGILPFKHLVEQAVKR